MRSIARAILRCFRRGFGLPVIASVRVGRVRHFNCKPGLAPAGALCFMAIVVLMHALRRDVDWRSNGVSHYAAGPHGWVIAVGVAALAVSLGARADSARGPQAWSAAVAAAGFLGVAASPIGGPASRERAHAICALVGLVVQPHFSCRFGSRRLTPA